MYFERTFCGQAAYCRWCCVTPYRRTRSRLDLGPRKNRCDGPRPRKTVRAARRGRATAASRRRRSLRSSTAVHRRVIWFVHRRPKPDEITTHFVKSPPKTVIYDDAVVEGGGGCPIASVDRSFDRNFDRYVCGVGIRMGPTSGGASTVRFTLGYLAGRYR